jgi:predicted RNA-binding protein with PIN domain
VIFSKNETADDKIKRMARKAVNPKVLIVITDDKEIQYFVKSYGVKRQTVKQFLNPISKKTRLATKSKYTSKDKDTLSSQKAIEITKELQEIWNDNN